MPHILIIGQKFSPLIDYLEKKGHTHTVIQDVLKTKFPEKKLKNRIVVDFSQKDTYLATIDSIAEPIHGVITVYENYIPATAIIADHLNLPGLPLTSAEACTDKSVMRSFFEQAPKKISPAFQTVESESQLIDFANSHTFPLILKPANLSKSLLVTKNSSLGEITENYRKSIALLSTTYKKYAPGRTPKLIVEEFLEGSIHSVDAFIDSEGRVELLDNIVDYQTGYDIGYDDNFHYSRILPSTLQPADQDSLRNVATLGIKALGMKSSAAHVEIIMTKQGPFIVEIGARSGGYRDRMHALANGIDIYGALVATALDKPLEITPQKNDDCAVLELFPKTPGLFSGISNEQALQQLPSLTYLSVKASDGDFVGKAADGYKMCAVVILSNHDSTQFSKDLSYINQFCRVQTRQSSDVSA